MYLLLYAYLLIGPIPESGPAVIGMHSAAVMVAQLAEDNGFLVSSISNADEGPS
jgi:hypothetical protein